MLCIISSFGSCLIVYAKLLKINSDLADPINQFLYPDDNNKLLYHHNRTILAYACEIRMNVINAITRTNKAKPQSRLGLWCIAPLLAIFQ